MQIVKFFLLLAADMSVFSHGFLVNESWFFLVALVPLWFLHFVLVMTDAQAPRWVTWPPTAPGAAGFAHLRRHGMRSFCLRGALPTGADIECREGASPAMVAMS